MATVRKRIIRPSGQVRWLFDYRDRDGKRRAKMFARKADAETYATKVRAELQAGTHTPPTESKTVEGAAQDWLLRETPEMLEAGTVRQYRQHVTLHIVPRIGSVKLCDLTTPRVETFKNELLRDLSRSMATAVLTSLKGIVKEAQRLGHASFNGTTPVKISKKRRAIAKDLGSGAAVAFPRKDELLALISASAGKFPLTRVETTRKREKKTVAVCWRPFVLTAIFTGMRCSELRGLTWDHVDIDAAIIRVRQRADFQNRMGAPKSEAGTRDIPLTPMVVNTLREWKLACPKTALNLVFPTENGRIHSNSNIIRTATFTSSAGGHYSGRPASWSRAKMMAPGSRNTPSTPFATPQPRFSSSRAGLPRRFRP
jgi:integrase